MIKNRNNKDNKSDSVICILAGEGKLPRDVYAQCLKDGRKVKVVGLVEETDIGKKSALDPCERMYLQEIKMIKPYQISSILRYMKKHNVRTVVMAGKVKRISFWRLLLDRYGISLLFTFFKIGFSDSSILHTLIYFLEKRGFKIEAANSFVPQIIVHRDALGDITPSDKYIREIQNAVKILESIGNCDIGQAIVVQDGLVIGVEAVEGTDALISRCGQLKQKSGNKPILVKMCKPIQDQRVDLPCIGPKTVENAAQNGFAGIAVQAGKTIILDEENVRKIADKDGLFIYGFDFDK